MRPVFENLSVTVQKVLQSIRTVLLLARPKNQVVGAGECIHTVKLHKSKRVQNALKVGTLASSRRPTRQPMLFQEQMPRHYVAQNRDAHVSASIKAICCRRTCRSPSTNIAVTNPMLSRPLIAAIPPSKRHSIGNKMSPNPSVVNATSAK